MLAQGNTLGFGISELLSALKVRRAFALSGRKIKLGHFPRGVAPGWHPPAPLARLRELDTLSLGT
jgi:hypothetical protein